MTKQNPNHGMGWNPPIELTFEEQQAIDKIAERAYTPSSNSNKYRFQLYAHIEQLIADRTAVPAPQVPDELRNNRLMDEACAKGAHVCTGCRCPCHDKKGYK